jgi:hypothetical protein
MRTKTDLHHLLEKSGIAFRTIESGRSWMVVCPALAARIMGAGIGEENAFWVPPVLSTRGWADGGNAGGQRTWIAPEGGPSGFFFTPDGTKWSVLPDLDPAHYRPAPALAGGASFRTELTARTAHGATRRISLLRSMTLEEDSSGPGQALTIRFRHELGNAGRSTLEKTIGLWSIIQLPCDVQGSVFFAYRRQGAALRRYFGSLPSESTGDTGSVAWLRVKGGTRFKAGMSPSDFAGTVGFVRPARVPETGGTRFTLTVMRFDVDPAGTYVDKWSYTVPSAPPNGDAAQAYCDAGTGDLAFCEIESHAPAPSLAPGASEGQDVRITVAGLDEQELGSFMRDKLGMEPLPRSALPA